MKTVRALAFRLAALLLPLLILVLLEAGLRLAGLFPREPLFVETVEEGREVTRLNPDVGRRYFNPKKVVVPNLYPETFARQKPAGTVRIFCLGGSTTAGFPFEFQVPFPAQLKTQLSSQYPDRRFEVINLGLSAVNSYTVLDFIPEVLGRQPDLILIYMGHNEFYGAYGSASALSFGQNGTLIRLYLRLQRLRLVQMVRAGVIALTPAAKVDPENTTLMEQVIADKAVPYASAKYQRTLRNFQDNLGEILTRCRRAGVPVIAGTLVCNLKDQPPLGSSGRDKPLETGKAAAACDQLIRQGRLQEALALVRGMIAQDSLSADLFFNAGKIELALGDSAQARTSFSSARDRDLVRFRASAEMNRIISQSVRKHEALLAEVDAAFASAAPGGIPGSELFCDHLHPNPEGYQRMASTYAAAIRRAGLILAVAPGTHGRIIPFAVTDLDWEIGLLRIFKLKHRWPFANQPVDYSRYRPHGTPAAARVAFAYLFDHHNWVRAHYAMADTFSSLGEMERARQEYWAVLGYYPERPEPWMKVAGSYEREGDWNRAEKAWLAAPHEAGKGGEIRYRLAQVQWRLGQKAAAIQSIQEAIVSPDLGAGQRLQAKLDLARFFIDLQRLEYARKVVEDILQEQPDSQAALEMKSRYFQ